MPTKAEIEILKERNRQETILVKIEERKKTHRKKCEEQEQKIKDCCDAGFMGYENSMDSCFHRLIEEHPFLEPLFLREMYWSRIRELEEVKKIIERGE